MRLFLILFVFAVFAGFAFRPAPAAELVMFESSACEWCDLWDEEVGVVYGKTDEAKAAPLRRVSIHDPMPADLKEIQPVIFTPTFVLMDQGREIGRVTGYPGEASFWGLLEGLVGRLGQAANGCVRGTRWADGGGTSLLEKQVC